MLIDQTVGPILSSSGSGTGRQRIGRTGAAVTTDAHGRFSEAVQGGNCYGVAMQSGVASQAGLSATTPILTLYNPIGSGVNGHLWYAGVTASVAVAAAAVVWIGVNAPASTAVTGTLTTSHRNLLLGQGQGNKISAFLAATLPAAPVAISTLGVLFAAALSVNNQQAPLFRWFDGGLLIGPGTAVSFQTSTASGAVGLFGEFQWEETQITA